MSYDISIIVIKEIDVFDVNYTYNVSPMYGIAFGNSFGINSIAGLFCKDAFSLLENAIDTMIDQKDKLILLNPVNGWGNYEGALKILQDILLNAVDYPDGVISIC